MRRRFGVLSIMAGLCLMAAARLGATPAAPPLYDGVIVQDPYRYLSPASGQAGSPTSAQASQAVTGGTSPQFVVATSESPPQAQLVAPVGAFVLPAGTTSMSVSIEAVPPGAMPSGRDISGNVYRFQVRDEAGADLAVTPGHEPTLLLRAPAGIFSGSIGRLSDGTWQDLTTQSTSQVGIFGAKSLGARRLCRPGESPRKRARPRPDDPGGGRPGGRRVGARTAPRPPSRTPPRDPGAGTAAARPDQRREAAAPRPATMTDAMMGPADLRPTRPDPPTLEGANR